MQPSGTYVLDPNDPYVDYAHKVHRHEMIERGVLFVGSVLSSLLLLRFVLALLAANPSNGFASFVYGFTQPFVAPFYNLFSYDHATVGVSDFQGYTLVALGVYSLAVAGIVRLLAIPHR